MKVYVKYIATDDDDEVDATDLEEYQTRLMIKVHRITSTTHTKEISRDKMVEIAKQKVMNDHITGETGDLMLYFKSLSM